MSLIICLSMGLSLNTPAREVTATEPSTVSGVKDIDKMVEDCIKNCIDSAFSMENVAEVIDNFVKKNKGDDESWSIEVIDLRTGQQTGYMEDLSQTAASSVKLFVAGAIMENLESVEERYPADVVERLMRAMLVISDNESSSELIAMLGNGSTDEGKSVVNDYCTKYGYDDTYIGILFSGVDPTGEYNITSAGDTAMFLQDIYNNELPGSETILDLMKASERLEKIPAALPGNVTSANKSGELDNTSNDSAIVFASHPFVLSILLDDIEFFRAGELIRELTEEVLPLFEQ